MDASEALPRIYRLFSGLDFLGCNDCSQCCHMPWFMAEENDILDNFFQDQINNHDGVSLHVSAVCRFANSGRCAIYQNRPLDCRLYPLDIVRHSDDRLWWCIYTTCPKKNELREQLAPLIPRIEPLLTSEIMEQFLRQIAVTAKLYAPYAEGRYECIRLFRGTGLCVLNN